MRSAHTFLKHGFLKKAFIIFICTALAAVLMVAAINIYMVSSTEKYIIAPEEAAALDADCIIVLGAKVSSDYRLSYMLEDRVLRGIELYELGCAPVMLMSGDHGRVEYDEVNAMMNYAVKAGVPSNKIFLDHAGFSTYESMYRAQHIFCAKKVIIVTQQFHLSRAVHTARALGLEAYGVSSDLRPYATQTYSELREIPARVKDFLTGIFKPYPTYLGEIIPLTEDASATHDKAAD